MKELLLFVALISAPVAIFVAFGRSGLDAFDEGGGRPASSLSVNQGLVAFVTECAQCHGRLAGGTERGPNLIHPDYGPSARSDAELLRSVREGMPARGGYGAMPPARGISERRVEHMIAFVREIQRANDIR